MSLITWSAALELGLPRMDATHREFVDLCNALAAAGDQAAFLMALDTLIAHTDAHFAQENRWMAGCGFPPIRIHMGEHERVLGLLRDTRERVAAGDLETGRRSIDELPDWFRGHAATMDAALAYHIRATGYDADAESEPASA